MKLNNFTSINTIELQEIDLGLKAILVVISERNGEHYYSKSEHIISSNLVIPTNMILSDTNEINTMAENYINKTK